MIQLRPAGGDDLTASDYREIYEEIRSNRSFREFCALVGEPENRIAWWSKYHRHLCELGDHERNILRRAVAMNDLPQPAGQIVRDIAPDAEVWAEPNATDAVLIVSKPTLAKIVQAPNLPTQANVTPVTQRKPYRPVWRPELPVEWRNELQARGLDLRQIIQDVLERKSHDTNAAHSQDNGDTKNS
jgi:hypothetical protein